MFFSWFEKRIDSFPAEDAPVPPKAFFPFVWDATKGSRRYILAMGFFAASTGAFEAFLFVVLGRIVDFLSVLEPSRIWEEEKGMLFLLAAVIIGSIILVAFQTTLKHQALATTLPMRLRWNFHRLLLGQSMAFFQNEFSGRIVTKVMQTALALRDFYMILVDIMVFASIYFLTMIASFGTFDLWLVAPFAIWLSLYIVLLRVLIPRLARSAREQSDARSIMVGRVTDAYTNIATVKLFSHAGREAAYAKNAMTEFLRVAQIFMRKVSWFEIMNQILNVALILGSSAVALWLWSTGQVGVGAVAAVGAMVLRLNGLSHWIMWESTQLFEHVGTIHDGIGTLSRDRAVTDKPGAEALRVTKGDVRFENVVFRYGPDQQEPTIDNFTLHINSGEKIGLVGRSGAGKTTLVSLLLRFRDVDSGRILIDGQNIAEVTQESLRSEIGMVMQDTSLLHRSVRDNILYGRPDATEEQVVIAARRAEADRFISELRDVKGRTGFDAHVGERGVTLSGGQRQRIAIARVMLKDAPILLLDEATSALDSEVEIAIQENLYRLMEGKTVVAIAHRLSTIAAMDRLVVVDQGRIVEEGTHAELLSRNGVYARLWAHQSGGFLGEDL